MNFNTNKKIVFFLNIILTFLLSSCCKVQGQEGDSGSTHENSAPASHHLRSPFQPPDEHGNTVNFQENHLRGDSKINYDAPVKSPYTPPPKSDDMKIARGKNNDGKQTSSPQNSRSPLIRTRIKTEVLKTDLKPVKESHKSPFQPMKKESQSTKTVVSFNQQQRTRLPKSTPKHQQVYRVVGVGRKRDNISPELKTIMARQQDNNHKIPSISEIVIHPHLTKTTTKQHASVRRMKVARNKPRHTSYQNRPSIHRDIHDVGPGVTPWTRYTQRPRSVGRNRDNRQSPVKGRCGRRHYSPRNQICCQGNILRRQGIQPSCCGSKGYDAVFDKCCNGEVESTSVQRPGC